MARDATFVAQACFRPSLPHLAHGRLDKTYREPTLSAQHAWISNYRTVFPLHTVELQLNLSLVPIVFCKLCLQTVQ